MSTGRKQGRAFTLVELIMVIAVLAVIVGLVVPHFGRSVSRIKFVESKKQLIYLMRYAQSRASAKNTQIALAVNSQDNSYQLLEKISPTEDAYVPIANQMGRMFYFDKNTSVRCDQSAIVFYPDGTIDKTQIELCMDKECSLVTTQIQRGQVDEIETNP